MKKTFCTDIPCVLSTPGPPLAALWSADKDSADGKWHISRTKETLQFIVKKNPLSTRAGAGLVNKLGRRDKARLAGGRVGQERTSRLLGNAIWGAFAWLGGRKRSL